MGERLRTPPRSPVRRDHRRPRGARVHNAEASRMDHPSKAGPVRLRAASSARGVRGVSQRLRPCLDCGRPSAGPRCSAHALPRISARPHRRVRAQVLAEESLCWLCGKPGTADDPLTFDHVIPRAFGGATTRANARAAHASCNSSRGARQIDGGDRGVSRGDQGQADNPTGCGLASFEAAGRAFLVSHLRMGDTPGLFCGARR